MGEDLQVPPKMCSYRLSPGALGLLWESEGPDPRHLGPLDLRSRLL